MSIGHDSFGELRAMLHASHAEEAASHLELLGLLERVAREDPEHFRDVWLPYIEDVPLPRVLARGWVEIARWADVLPAAVAPLHVTTAFTSNGPRELRTLYTAWSKDPRARHIHTLTVYRSGDASKPDMARFLGSPHLTSLTSLTIEGERQGAFAATQYGDASVLAVASNEALANLEHLCVSSIALGKKAWRALANSTNLTNLRRIVASGCFIKADVAKSALRSFEKAKGLQALRALDIGCNRCTTPEGWQHLGASDVFASLTHLKANSCVFGEDGFASLATSYETSLVSLDLSFAEGVSPYFPAFMRSSRVADLRELAIQGVAIGGEGFQALLESNWIAHVDRLDLSCCELTDEDLVALATCEHLGHIHHLDFSHSAITSRGIEALVKSPHLKKLITLNLAEARIKEAGAKALAGCEALSSLTSLNLANNRIGDKGFASLLAAPHLSQLIELDVGKCELTAKSAERFVGMHEMQALDVIVLRGNNLRNGGALAIASAAQLEGMREIDLCHNGIGERGLAALADSRLSSETLGPSYRTCQ